MFNRKMTLIRRQLPVYSPVSAAVLPGLLRQLVHLGADPRQDLRTLLKREYDANEVLLCGSGTQALTIAIRAALNAVEPGSSVALPAFSCFDVATAAVGADAYVTFYDLDPDTLAPDLDSLERALKERARVVVAAPLYGIPIEWEPLRDLCDAHGALLIEDAAQGHGARWKGRKLGSLGEISILSFGRGKGWTGGSGGAFVSRPTRDLSTQRIDLGASRAGRDACALVAQWALARPAVYGIPASIPALQLGETVYRDPTEPRAISRASAATLLATRADADGEAQKRGALASRLLESIGDFRHVRAISLHTAASGGYLRFPVRLTKGISSFASRRLALSHGIAPSYPSLLRDLSEIAGRIMGRKLPLPGAQVLVRTLVTLPTHSQLGPCDVEQVRKMLAEAR